MFPEFRELIPKLKHEDRQFDRLFTRHNQLDQKITHMTSRTNVDAELEIEQLKKEKLKIKDELYTLLRKASTARH